MKLPQHLEEKLHEIAKNITQYEPDKTQAGRTTGEAQGGRTFESIIEENLSELIRTISKNFSDNMRIAKIIDGKGNEVEGLSGLVNTQNHKAIIIKFDIDIAKTDSIYVKNTYPLRIKYKCTELYDGFLGSLINRKIPHIPLGEKGIAYLENIHEYKKLYLHRQTKFDGLVILGKGVMNADCGMYLSQICEKYLIEIKVAKSSYDKVHRLKEGAYSMDFGSSRKNNSI